MTPEKLQILKDVMENVRKRLKGQDLSLVDNWNLLEETAEHAIDLVLASSEAKIKHLHERDTIFAKQIAKLQGQLDRGKDKLAESEANRVDTHKKLMHAIDVITEKDKEIKAVKRVNKTLNDSLERLMMKDSSEDDAVIRKALSSLKADVEKDKGFQIKDLPYFNRLWAGAENGRLIPPEIKKLYELEIIEKQKVLDLIEKRIKEEA
jgi:exonuclease VII large subunit